MAVELFDAVNFDGLFDQLGKLFYALDTLNTARLTTVPDEVEDALEYFKNISGGDIDLQQTIDNVAAACEAWQDAGSTLASPLRQACENLLVEYVKADTDLPQPTLTDCLDELIDQMTASSSYVDPNVVAISVAAGSDNIGDPAILYTRRRGDGRVQENIIGEAIEVEVTADESETSPTLRWKSERGQANMLAEDWPQGSGVNRSLAATDPASSLLSNGDFEDTTIANIPDDWIVVVGTPGVTVHVTNPEVQTVVISGTGTGGSYILYWVDRAGIQRATETLAYDASGSAVQSALREIPALENIDVSTTGTSPDYTHTITFTGVAGNLNQLTSRNLITGSGTAAITHATTTQGTDGAYKGRALALESNGSELTRLYHPLDLEEEVVYFCHFRLKRSYDDEQSSSSSSSLSESSSSSSLSSSSQSSLSSSSSSSLSASSSSSSSPSSSSSSSTSSEIHSESSASSTSESSSSPSSTSSVEESHSSPSSTSSQSSGSQSSPSSSSETSSSTSSVEESHSSSASLSSDEHSESSAEFSASSISSSSLSSSSTSSEEASHSSSSSPSSSSSSTSSRSSTSSSSSSSSVRSSSSSSQSAEEIRVEVVEGIGSGPSVDAEGYENQLRIDATTINSGTHDSKFFSFRLRRDVVEPVYLRIHVASPLTSGDVLYFDEMVVVQATELYKGGPYVEAVSGATAAVLEDLWTLTLTNNRAGDLQEWFQRAFDMANKDFLLPSSGTTNVPDALIC